MRTVARFSTRHARPVLVAWALVLVAALVIGANVTDRISQPSVRVPGTDAALASDLAQRQFGGTVAMAVLLQGPRADVERRGPIVVRELQKLEGVQVLSPWAIGGARVLREPPGQALLALQVRRPFDEIATDTVPAVERVLKRTTGGTVRSETTGLAPLVRALNQASIDSLHRGELVALPVLFVMLLLIFGSPVAALVPALAGLLVTRIGTAALGVIAEHVAIDALALTLMTMVGLALGVDYALLVVSRFREELARGASVEDAVETAAARAGRTVTFAGAALALGMLCAVLVAPGSLLVASGLAIVVAAVVAVLVALLAMPAALALLGPAIDRWPIPRPALAGGWRRRSERILRSPGLAVAVVTLPLLLLSAPALALNSGPPDVANLPPGNAARKSYEEFERVRGAGWSTPYEVLFRTDGPVTTTARLKALRRFQDRVAKLEGVEAVLGPAALLDRTKVLRQLTRDVVEGRTKVRRLERGLDRASGGTGELRDGLRGAAGGAGRLAEGLGRAAAGSDLLARTTRDAGPQTQRLASGVQQTAAGSKQLAGGAGKASDGSSTLAENLKVVRNSIAEGARDAESDLTDPASATQSAVQSALRNLGSIQSATVSGDPSVVRAKSDLQKALTELGPLRSNIANLASNLDTNAAALRELSKGADQLAGGLQELASGSRRLEGGIQQTADGASQLASGVGQLSSGTSQLSGGLNTLLNGPNGNDGARALAAGLTRAVTGTNDLGRGLRRMLDSVVTVRRTADARQRELRRTGTDPQRAADSGYFVLAAVEGAKPQTQTNVAFATNAASGGNTARVIVVPSSGPFGSGSGELRAALQREAGATGGRIGARAVVGGPAIVLDDFDRATRDRFPLLVVVLSLVTFLVLLAAFRAPLLALLAVGLNLVTVGAAIGVLVLLFQGDAPLLGGSGQLDAIALMGILGIIFGLSIDYEVFLMSRLVEGRRATGDTDGAIGYALERTAGVITGAAFIMAAVFLAFAASPVMSTRQFGVGTTVAVLLDATVVRLVLLPALVKLLGERTWWTPRWLGGRTSAPAAEVPSG